MGATRLVGVWAFHGPPAMEKKAEQLNSFSGSSAQKEWDYRLKVSKNEMVTGNAILKFICK